MRWADGSRFAARVGHHPFDCAQDRQDPSRRSGRVYKGRVLIALGLFLCPKRSLMAGGFVVEYGPYSGIYSLDGPNRHVGK